MAKTIKFKNTKIILDDFIINPEKEYEEIVNILNSKNR